MTTQEPLSRSWSKLRLLKIRSPPALLTQKNKVDPHLSIGQFSTLVWSHFLHAPHRGQLADFCGEGWAGDTRLNLHLRIQLSTRFGSVDRAGFQTLGCVPAIACGEFLCTWCMGKNLTELKDLTPTWLRDELGGLPPGRELCAELALHALKRALEDIQSRDGLRQLNEEAV